MVGSLGELISEWSNGVKDFTDNGKCSQCGQCCSDILPLSKDEIKRIRRYMREHEIKENVHRPPVVTQTFDITCPFRNDAEKKCEIYAVRPRICKAFICNKPPTEADNMLFASTRHVISMRNTFFGRYKK